VSVKVIAELNPASLERTTLAAEPGSVSAILRGLDTGFPEEHARVSLNGAIVKDFSVQVRDGDTLWVKFVFYGSDNQDTGNYMKAGGVALTALGVVLSVATLGVGAAIGAGLIGAGIGMLAGGIALYNIDIPDPLQDRERPESDPSIRGSRNQLRQYGRIPVLFGRHRIYPDLAAPSYTEIEGNAQYLVQLFCCGYRDCTIDTGSFKLGEISLLEFSSSGNINTILAGDDTIIKLEIIQDGRASALYPRCVNELMLNAPVKKLDDQGHPGAIIRNTPDKTDAINVDIFFYNGLGKYDAENNVVTASVEVRASYKPVDAPDDDYELVGIFGEVDNVISGSALKTKRCQVTKSGLTPGVYTVKIERVTDDTTDSKTIDAVYAGSIRSMKSAPPIRAARQQDLTIIAMRTRATENTTGSLDAFNCVAQSTIPVYAGGGASGPFAWQASEATGNPAAMLLWALRGRAVQQKVADSDIDWPALEEFYLWCDEHGYTCNAYLTESVTVSELFRMIGGTARAEILRIDSKISVVQDVERPAPIQLFTPKNTIDYSETLIMADVPDALALQFIDAESGYAENELMVYNTPSGNPAAAEPETIQKVNLWGVTDSAQARRIGMYNYGCTKNRPIIHTLEVDIEYLLCNKGDWIQYAGDIALAGSTQGRIAALKTAGGLCTGFYTDEPIEMAAGSAYAVRVRRPDGTVLLENVLFNAGPRNEIDLTFPLAAADTPEAGAVYAFGIWGKEVIDLVVTDIRPQADLRATLTCVEYSPEIFGVDEPGFELPVFANKVSAVQGALDSGAVNPDDWSFFEVYHDAEAEPPRPTGDGESGGWHRGLTTASVWRSSKVAPSASGGAWSAPVRFKGESGSPGLNGLPAAVHELLPGATVIKRDSSGDADPAQIACDQQVIVGNKPPAPADKTIKYVTSANPNEAAYTDPLPVAWDWIEFRLYDGQKLLDQERIFVLAEGEPARVYKVQPGASAVRVYDGIADPYRLSCFQVSITGNGLPVPADKTLKYATSASEEQPYTGEIPIDPLWQWIEFRLYDEDLLLDKERVPVLKDGASLVYLDPENQHITIVCDEWGEPYTLPIITRAVLYEGNTPVTYNRFMANLAAREIVHYPGETLSGEDFPVQSLQWSVSQGRIDQDGNITIDTLTEDEIAIEVSARYDGAVHTAVITVRKLKDGAAAVNVDIENENASIPCDADGVPLPGALPLETKAVLYHGVDLVSPFWFLRNAPRGIDINQNGIITVAADAELGDVNNVPVLAAWRGTTHTQTFSLTKAKAGGAATRYALRPSVSVIRRDAESGVSVPPAISCAQEVTVGNSPPGPADKTIKYITSSNSNETVYTGEAAPVAWDWIEFRLYDELNLLDAERIPVLSNGTNGTDGDGGAASVDIDLEDDNTSIPCDSQGVPYPEALPVTTRAVLYEGWDMVIPVWSLENPPAGVSIDQNGTITVHKGAVLGSTNRIVVKAVYGEIIRTAIFTLTKVLDGESPVSIGLVPDRTTLPCDYLGNPEVLPITAQAQLYKGVQEITAAMELAEAARVEILYYPGNIFDPMLGDFYPTRGYPVTWSLPDAPAGVTIDQCGLITVSAAAQLADRNEISVQASYHGKTYETIFGITKAPAGGPGRGVLDIVAWYYLSDSPKALIGGDWTSAVPDRVSGKFIWQKMITTFSDGTTSETEAVCITGDEGKPGKDGDPAAVPRYRGVTFAADTGNTGIVTLGSGGTIAVNKLDWVLFMGAADWTKARLYQWTGAVWTVMAPTDNPLQYMEALKDITEGAPDGIFSNVFCRVLFAQQAAIETLQSQLIQIGNAIFGGERFVRSGNSVIDNGADKPGFMLGADGRLVASKGLLDAITISGDSYFTGTINSGPLFASSDIIEADTGVTYGPSSTIRNVWAHYGFPSYNPGTAWDKIVNLISGSYGDRHDLIRIEFHYAPSPILYKMYLYFRTLSPVNITGSFADSNPTIGDTLIIGGGSAGKTFRLIDLPVGKGDAIGDVYADTSGLLHIKLS
jgi:hypothetical protein